MATNRPLLEELLEFAVRLARDAGEVALSHFGKNPPAERKDDGTIVTVADRQAERLMRERLQERYPDDAVVGEEFGVQPGRSGRRWILDPIDGTFSYARRVPLFGTLVGVEIDGEPCVGVVRLPALDETACAAKGLGATWNGTPARVSTVAALGDALAVCGDFFAGRANGMDRATQRIELAVRARRGWGDCYGHLLVATGRAEVALDHVMSVWDCAALLPIVEEAGGTFTDWRGHRTIEGGNAISTNGAVFEDVMKLVRARP